MILDESSNTLLERYFKVDKNWRTENITGFVSQKGNQGPLYYVVKGWINTIKQERDEKEFRFK